MICLIWPWLTLLLMQPNTTRALGCRDGLYWKANLRSQRKSPASAFCAAFRPAAMAAGEASYFWASSVHWSNHLQAGMSRMQA